MADKKIHGFHVWVGCIASVISIVVFFTARPYFKDFTTSQNEQNKDAPFIKSEATVSGNQQKSEEIAIHVTKEKQQPESKFYAKEDIPSEPDLKVKTNAPLNNEEAAPKYSYVDGFNNNVNQWPVYSKTEGSCTITDGKYLLQSNVVGTQMSIAKVLTTNERTLNISVTTRHIDGRMDSGYGLAFNANNDGTHYSFEIAGDSYAAFFKINNKQTTLIPWTPSPSIRSQNNETNVLRIRLKSNVFEMYINDVYVNSYKISFGMGWIGVVVENQQSVEFDNYSF